MNWLDFFRYLIDTAVQYFVIVSIIFFTIYILLKKRVFHKKIQLKFPKVSEYKRDIINSAISILIMASPVFILLGNPTLRSYTTYYSDINEYGIPYLFGALILMIFMHDTYFYWMHRLIHHPKLFKAVHLTHHKSTNPSPWTSYAFHPFEAVLESLIFVIFLFTLPIHPILITTFFAFNLWMTIYGHLGYEFLPKGWTKHWLGKWISTSVAHNQHHHHFNKNFGLYFTIWDRLMGTLSDNYDQAYLNATTKKRKDNI